MDKIIYIIKIWALAQFILIFILLFVFYLTRKYLNYKINKRIKIRDKIKKLFHDINENPQSLTDSAINFFNKFIFDFIFELDLGNEKYRGSANWQIAKLKFSKYILQTQSKRLLASKDWFKEYLGLRCYELGINIEDDQVLLNLIKSNIFLVAINAAMIIFNNPNPNPNSVNAIISEFSKQRHLLQNTFIDILIGALPSNKQIVVDIIRNRLKTEKNVYARIFCYRILTKLPPSTDIDSFIQNDLLDKNTELNIAALKYLYHINFATRKEMLLTYLNDPRPKIRIIVTKLLGELDDDQLIPVLEDKLHDPEWWVRVNAAYALAKLGKAGLAILQAQTYKEDKFAYEVAQFFTEIIKRTGD